MKTPLCEFSFETILPHSCTLCWSTLLGLACLLSELAPAWATDTNGPQAVSAATLLSSAQIGVRFNEPLDPATATNAANYQLDNGATVTGAALRPDGSNVLLTASGYVLTNFTVTINNVLDLATNAIAPNSQVTVQALTMEARDFGGPTERGSSFSSLPGEVDMVAGGADIWNYPDSFHFLYELRDGDFDLRVRIARLDLKATYTFAGLHVREDLSLGARCLKAVLFPPTGANAYTLDYRSTTNGGGANLPRSNRTGKGKMPRRGLQSIVC